MEVVLRKLEGRLREALERAGRRAARRGRTQWLSLSAQEMRPRDPQAEFRAAREPEVFYWEHPARQRWLVARGALCAIECEGPRRFADCSERARALFSELQAVGEEAPGNAGPLLVGAFRFSADGAVSAPWRDFSTSRMVLPELLLRHESGRTWSTLSFPVPPDAVPEKLWPVLVERIGELGRPPEEPADARPRWAEVPEYRAVADRSHAEYRAGVAAALEAIAASELEKVVLARSVQLLRTGRFAVTPLLDHLRRTHPSCVSFALRRGNSTFLGATPECMVRLRSEDWSLETGAVAGSAPRGRSPHEDARHARVLRESKKEQAEHEVVVRGIREALHPFCGELEGPEAPGLLRLEGIQHLETPLRGRLRGDLSRRPGLLDLVGALHPTPAVGGAPAAAARDWIARHEELDRGCYAAPVGYLDARGGGEFRVALRSALLREGEARLFAGAGVVAGSDPEGELRETRLKLGTLLSPLMEI
jgi:isochorismate synthase